MSLVSHFVMEFSPINQDLVTAVEQLFSEGYSSNALSSLMTRYVLNDSWEEQAQDLTGKRYRASFSKTSEETLILEGDSFGYGDDPSPERTSVLHFFLEGIFEITDLETNQTIVFPYQSELRRDQEPHDDLFEELYDISPSNISTSELPQNAADIVLDRVVQNLYIFINKSPIEAKEVERDEIIFNMRHKAHCDMVQGFIDYSNSESKPFMQSLHDQVSSYVTEHLCTKSEGEGAAEETLVLPCPVTLNRDAALAEVINNLHAQETLFGE